MPAVPRPLLILGGACAVVTLAFVITAPWSIGRVTIDRLEAVLPIWLIPAAFVLLHARSRKAMHALLETPLSFRRITLIVALAVVLAFLVRATSAKYNSLHVSAWDFSLSFDRPVERTLHGDILWSDDRGHSMLGVHANWLLFAFVPLYAIVASPWWLILGQAVAFAAAVALLFLCTRAVSGDDLLAGIVAAAFLLNRYTANAAQALFIIDVFYPAALFLLFYAFLRERPRLFAVALLLTVAIKEDAILPLTGFALVAAIGYRRWRWAAAAVAAGAAVFLIDFFVVLPAFGFWSGPAYASDWASYGATPKSALLGMIKHPLRVMGRTVNGAADLFATLAFVPLAGWPWILASLPPLVILGSADSEQIRSFTLHYSMPVLPGLFLAIAFATAKVSSLPARRIVALTVLAVSALIGSSYRFERARSERRFILTAVREAGARDLFVQGSLLPHAGYARNIHALYHQIVPPPRSGFLLCATCSAYPFTKDEIAARIRELQASGNYETLRHGDLVLLRPLTNREAGLYLTVKLINPTVKHACRSTLSARPSPHSPIRPGARSWPASPPARHR